MMAVTPRILTGLVLYLACCSLVYGQLPFRATYGGSSTDPWAGDRLASIGDLDGDGCNDFLIALPYDLLASGFPPFQPPVYGNGRVAAVSGADGSLIHDLYGPMTYSGFGAGLDGLDDLDGDGIPEMLIGIPEFDPGTPLNQAGLVVILSGIDASILRVHTGSTAGSRAGKLAVNVGDVDLDGVSDYAHDDLGSAAGDMMFLEVRSGATGSVINLLTVSATAMSASFGVLNDNNSPPVVVPAGDVNGDGRADIAIGSRSAKSSPSFPDQGGYLVYSAFDGQLLASGAGTYGELLGSDIAGAGDRNNDGYDDFYVGAPGMNNVYLISGLDGSTLATISGATTSFGYDLEAGRDLDGDGDADLVVLGAGTSGSSTNLTTLMEVFSGSSHVPVRTVDGIPVIYTTAGGRVSKLCEDLDGDGMADLVCRFGGAINLPLPGAAPGIHVLSFVGSRAYGAPGGARLLDLSWTNGGSSDLAVGVLSCDGADPFAGGIIAASLAPANSMVSGLPLLVSNDPLDLLPLAYFGYDLTGQLLSPLSLRSPFVNGTTYFLQGFQSTFPYGASNGLELLFTY